MSRRGCTRGLAVAGVVAASLLLAPAPADAATPHGKLARPATPAAAAPAASSASATPPRVSPYTIAARKHAQAASGAAHAPAVPPTMRRTRQAIGQRVR
jgi:hypothetical protein